MTPTQFRKIVWDFYRAQGRHDLPWRKTHDVYKILVSEVMLQQTQVDRVIPFYKKFIKQFPTARRLAAAPLSDVLKAWQGLGYNRRAKLLHEAVQHLATTPSFGTRSNLVEELEKLPGVGHYTARAVAAFAFNADTIVIETNIRTVIIHHFFSTKRESHQAGLEKVSDAEIAEVLERVLPKGKSREWYSALMDYGAHLKRTNVSHNARSKSYAPQSRFAGSLRQARGAILRELTHGPATRLDLVARSSLVAEKVNRALDALLCEGLVQKKRTRYALAD